MQAVLIISQSSIFIESEVRKSTICFNITSAYSSFLFILFIVHSHTIVSNAYFTHNFDAVPHIVPHFYF